MAAEGFCNREVLWVPVGDLIIKRPLETMVIVVNIATVQPQEWPGSQASVWFCISLTPFMQTFGYGWFSILHTSLIFHISCCAPGWAPDGRKSLPLFLESNDCQHPVSAGSGSRRSLSQYSPRRSALNKETTQRSEQRRGHVAGECLGLWRPGGTSVKAEPLHPGSGMRWEQTLE